MEDIESHHKVIVTNFIKNKLEEFEYFLKKIIGKCDEVNRNFLNRVEPADSCGGEINYFFSALTNCFQSFKDTLSTATGDQISWSRFSSVRYADFIEKCRNAITHDGMQIINGYVDGKYYIASKVERFDNRGRLITVEAPQDDVLAICLFFSKDLMLEIEKILVEYGEDIPSGFSVYRPETFHSFMESHIVPQLAKNIFFENKVAVEEAMESAKIDPVADINERTARIIMLCDSLLW